MKIRTKIMLGFLILVGMLAIAGSISVYELKKIGSSVQSLLDDNYRSINAAKDMIEALEREDSGMLLLLSGKWKEGRDTIQSANKNFIQALEIAENNLTVKGEKAFVEQIQEDYKKYRKMWDQPIVGTIYENNLNWYLEDVHEAFKEVKASVQKLMSVNDKVMYETASGLKNRAHQAIMPGIIAILSALVFALLFNFFVNIYFVNPILSITHSIDDFLSSNKPVSLKVNTKDELADLAHSVSELVALVKLDRKKAKS